MVRSALTGSRIRQRRIHLGLRQAELARRLGVSASYLNLIEHNRRRVAPDLLERAATELGIDSAALSEGADAALLETLRDAAAAVDDNAEIRPELDRLEDLAGRFPGWAELMAAQHSRLAALERSVERLSDRMTHDPHLSASLHEVLSVAASLRSTAAILSETDDIPPEWQERFHGNLRADSLRLADGAQALVGYLEASEEDESGLAAPQEELEAWLAARDYHVAELEVEGKSPPRVETLIEGAALLASRSARALALNWLRRYRRDAEAIPLAMLTRAVAAHGVDPARLAQIPELGGDMARLLRRLANLPPEVQEGAGARAGVGLIICDGSGTMTFRKPVPNFGMPRFGAACPLWPLFQALARPLEPIHATLETAGRLAQRFRAYAFCTPVVPPAFDAPTVVESSMLIVPAGAGTSDAASPLTVGTSCRICPKPDCPARREPSIIAHGF